MPERRIWKNVEDHQRGELAQIGFAQAAMQGILTKDDVEKLDGLGLITRGWIESGDEIPPLIKIKN